jgi:hypothetical protein
VIVVHGPMETDSVRQVKSWHYYHDQAGMCLHSTAQMEVDHREVKFSGLDPR